MSVTVYINFDPSKREEVVSAMLAAKLSGEVISRGRLRLTNVKNATTTAAKLKNFDVEIVEDES
jgi:hypothetical protein